MNRFYILLLITFLGLQTNAQQRYYIFIQTENPSAFYIKKDNKIQSSNAGGYLIISNLPDGKHDFLIGFPDNSLPEQYFSIGLQGKDKSFLLKNFNDKGWGLFDLQDLSITHAFKTEPGFKLKPAEDISPFTNVLVKASGDSTLKYTAVVPSKHVNALPKKEEAVVQTIRDGQTTNTATVDTKVVDAVLIKETEVSTEVQKPETSHIKQLDQKDVSQQMPDTLTKAIETPLINIGDGKENETKVSKDDQLQQSSGILKISEVESKEGWTIVYKEILPDGKQDTISLLINNTNENPSLEASSQKKPTKKIRFLGINISKDSLPASKTESVKSNKSQKTIEPADIGSKSTGKTCSDQVSDKELIRLRDKMALIVTDEQMITEAQSVFIQKCMTSSQVKRLSELFVTNAGKYSFFKAVYPYVSDKQYFYTLRSELSDEHYNNRFVDILQSR